MLLNASREDGLSYWSKHENVVLHLQFVLSLRAYQTFQYNISKKNCFVALNKNLHTVISISKPIISKRVLCLFGVGTSSN